MNKIWKTLVVVLFIATTAFGQQRGPKGGQQAQNQQSPPPVPTTKQIIKIVDKFSRELLLSKEQKSEVLEIYKTHFKEVESKTKSGRPNRSEMDELKMNFEDKVKAVLSKDQQKLFTAYQKKNNKREKSQRKK
tara:strand:+ start:51049 stop:51447 length:399 start_codon:yes stop_codon:yes gene_type:complete